MKLRNLRHIVGAGAIALGILIFPVGGIMVIFQLTPEQSPEALIESFADKVVLITAFTCLSIPLVAGGVTLLSFNVLQDPLSTSTEKAIATALAKNDKSEH